MYKSKTDNELFELLKKHKKLAFSAQLELQRELERRKLNEYGFELQKTISQTEDEIEALQYLKDLGYQAIKTEGSLIVRRTQKAMLIDILASLLGVLCCYIGFRGIVTVLGSLFGPNEIGLMTMVTGLLKTGLGVLGIGFLNGVGRFLDNLGFELKNSGGMVSLGKRFDFKLLEIEKSPEHLGYEENANRLVLKLEDYEVLSGNAKSLVQNKTVRALGKQLTSFGRLN